MAGSKTDYRLLIDLGIIAAGVALAALFINTDIVETLLHTTRSVGLISSFVAGIFFTSVLTTAPAVAALAEIAEAQGMIITAVLGAAGSVVGDSILFYIMRDRISDRLIRFAARLLPKRRRVSLLDPTVTRWLLFALAGVVIASPLPDEIGISILGLSKVNPTLFIPVSFFFNFVGILVIGLIAGAAL